MKLKSLRIENFRSFEDQTIDFESYTTFVGANGSGKSTVFHALNVFFRDDQTPGLNTTELAADDFHDKNTDVPIRLTVTFNDLSDQARDDFRHYCRQGQLIVSAVAEWDQNTGRAVVRQCGHRLAIPAFARFFEADKNGVKVEGLKDIYAALKKDYPDLPNATTKGAMSQALREYEDQHFDDCEELPSEDQFYGISKGANLLEKHVQWVYVPAVKEFSTETKEAKGTFLGKLLARTVRQKISFDDDIDAIRTDAKTKYEDLLTRTEGALEETSKSLSKRIVTWANPEAKLKLLWDYDGSAVQVAQPFAKTIAGEGEFEGQLTRFGHGFQRAYLLALLEELANSDAPNAPTLIIACEEPELYQHPPQARHLYDVFSKLASGNTQVLACTHSPYFVSGDQFENVRLVRKAAGHTTISAATIAQVTLDLAQAGKVKPEQLGNQGNLAKIHQVLQPNLNEIFFTSRLILVEGLEDVAYIATYLQLTNRWDEYRRLGCHMVPANGKSEMPRPLAIAQCLKVPVFVVFDADGDTKAERIRSCPKCGEEFKRCPECGEELAPEADGRRAMHEKDNRVILTLCGLPGEAPFPGNTLFEDRCVAWPTKIADVVKADIGQEQWDAYATQVSNEFDNAPDLKKNTLFIARILEVAWQSGRKSRSLEKLCDLIITFANSDTSRPPAEEDAA